MPEINPENARTHAKSSTWTCVSWFHFHHKEPNLDEIFYLSHFHIWYSVHLSDNLATEVIAFQTFFFAKLGKCPSQLLIQGTPVQNWWTPDLEASWFCKTTWQLLHHPSSLSIKPIVSGYLILQKLQFRMFVRLFSILIRSFRAGLCHACLWSCSFVGQKEMPRRHSLHQQCEPC